jgi:hypothetical protein
LARLHLKALEKQITKKRVLSALNRLPAGLDETYQAALERIGNDDIGMRTLKWVTCAKRHLTAAELQHALAVEPTTNDIDEDDLIEVPDLISRCAGLVMFDSESGIFRLVHFTAQKFLQDLLKDDGDAEITAACLRYLSFPGFSYHFPDSTSMNTCLQKYKLGHYAARRWFEHLQGRSENEKFHSRILETFGSQGTRDSVFQIMVSDVIPIQPHISILLYASMCGLFSLCRKVLDDSKIRYHVFESSRS